MVDLLFNQKQLAVQRTAGRNRKLLVSRNVRLAFWFQASGYSRSLAKRGCGGDLVRKFKSVLKNVGSEVDCRKL